MKQFIRYLRDQDGRPFGCVMAVLGLEHPDSINWGASLCNPKDRFCRKRAREIAMGRATKIGSEENMLYRDLPFDRTVALRDAVAMIKVDLAARYGWQK